MERSNDPAFADGALHDVAIVGFGLTLRGLSVLVLEREADIYRLPRAIHFDADCMRVFQTLGLAQTMLPQLIVSPGMKFVDAAGRVLIDYSRSREVGPQGWHPSYRFHQPDLESTLRKRLATEATATVRLRHDVFAIEPEADRVVLRVEDMATGRLKRTAARYVVGCDGARSLVRRFMGTELEDMQSHERWIVLDVLLKREMPELGDHSLQFCDPDRPATYVRGVGNRRRWELMLMPGDDPATIVRPESVWPLLSRWVSPKDAVLERPAVYTFHSVVAQGWRNGRLLIAGDAAHQTPPFMGQGMCAGIRDAVNLAWKLADVVRGHAPDRLLDTYESERSPHVREFIQTAVRLGGIIQATDRDQARERDARMAAQPEVFHTPQPALGPGAHEGGNSSDPANARFGRLWPQPRLADGRLLDDTLGYRYAVIATPELAAGLPALSDRVAVVSATDPAVRAGLDTAGVGAVLMRPDRHVAGVARDAASLAALLARYLPTEGVR